MKKQLFRQLTRRLPAVLILVITLGTALTASGASLAASPTRPDARLSSSSSNTDFRSSPVIFIESAPQAQAPDTGLQMLLRGAVQAVDNDTARDRTWPQDEFPQRSTNLPAQLGTIAFESDRNGGFDIFTQEANGASSAIPWLVTEGEDVTPEWSPDGSRIVYASDRDGDFDIYVRTIDGQEQRLTNNTADDAHPSWSPSGNHIIFTSNRNGDYFQIYSMRADGSDVRQVGVIPGNHAMFPHYSPNGNRIVFMRASVAAPVCQWNWDVWTMNDSGGDQRCVTTHLMADIYPRWSPDGSQIVFAGCRNYLDFDLFAVNPITGVERRLTSWFLANEWAGAYSTDGRYVAFSTDIDGNIEIYTMPADGGSAVNLTRHSASDGAPSWKPAGSVSTPTPTPTRTATPTPIPTRTPTPTSAPTYTISGRVTEAGGFAGIPGVTVWAGFPRNTTTDANGNYTFTGLPAGTYVIRPEKAPYAFSPRSRTVTVPADQTGVDFRRVAITRIQVNQVLGNTTNYVAGKDTAVRVFMSGPVPYDPDHQQLQVYRNGSLITLTPLRPRSFTGHSDVLDFLCDRQECDGWQKGFYSFEARVNGDYLIQPSVEFKERRGLRILAVNVKVTDRGQVRQVPDEQWKSAHTWLEKVYPIAFGSVVPTYSEWDASAYDLTKPGDRDKLWTDLKNMQPPKCGTFLHAPCFDKIVGFIPYMPICGTIPCTGNGCMKGWTKGEPATMVMANGSYIDDSGQEVRFTSMQETVAHEIGHTAPYLLGDEYNYYNGAFQCQINPPPSSYVGREWGKEGCNNYRCDPSPAVAWPGPGTGSMVLAGVDNPFDVTGKGALEDKLSFMGSSGAAPGDYWITSRIYNRLFDELTLSTVTLATQTQAENLVRASGRIGRNDSLSTDPWHQVIGFSPVPATGAYTIEALDGAGQVLASQIFDVSFVALSNPPLDVDPAPFQVTVSSPSGTASFRIRRNSTILGTVPISSHTPNVAVTSPIAGQFVSGMFTIQWQSNDLDGDSLYHTVEFSPDGQNWLVLAGGITETRFTANFDLLGGGNQAQVRVIVSDGVNTAESNVVSFRVPSKRPEAFITYPAEGASFMPGASFFLQGTAYDLEDGTLPDSAYRWRSNRDGDLGTGVSNLVILSPGPHVITLTVTDSDGNSAAKTIRLSAGDRLFLPLIRRSQ